MSQKVPQKSQYVSTRLKAVTSHEGEIKLNLNNTYIL
jgi:hypothetical protein